MVTIRLSVLGPTTVWDDGAEVTLPPRQRAVLAALAICAPRAADTERLIELVWGDDPPKSARASLHNVIGRLRGELGDDVIVTEGQAYRLSGEVDLDVARALGASAALPVATEPDVFSAITDRWADEAYPALHPTADVLATRAQLREAKYRLLERRAGSLLLHDRPAEAVTLLRSLTGDRTSSVTSLLAVALYRTGDQVDAARVLDDAVLDDRPDLIDSLRTRVLAGDERIRDASIIEEILAPVDDNRADLPIVGRENEIELIGHAVKQGAVIVRGEGGAGKTVVIRAAESELPGIVVRTVCSAVPRSPYGPMLDLLEQLVERPAVQAMLTDVLLDADHRALRWVAPPLARWLDTSETAQPEPRREPADRSLIDVFGRLGAALPITIVVDDYHRAPRTSQRLFSAMADAGEVRLLIGTRPDGDLELPGGVMIDLRPLGPRAVADLVALHLGTHAGLVSTIADELVRLTGGNAFFVESMIRHLAAIGGFCRNRDGWTLAHRPGLPVTIEAAVMERLDELSRRGVELVELLAVSSEPMALGVLASIDPGLPIAVPELLEAGVVEETAAGIQVAHDLVADAVLAKVAPVRLIDLHDELAEAYERSDEPNRVVHIARHRFGARSLDPGGAVEALRAAGELERARSSPEFAIEHFERAREVLDAPESIADVDLAVQEGLARRDAVDTGSVDVLRGAAEKAFELEAYELAAHALIGLGDVGQVTTSGGGDPELIDLVERIMAQLDDPTLRVRLRVTTLAWFALGSTWRRPQEIWRDALEAAEGLDDPELRWEVLRHVDWGVDGPDQIEQRLAVGRELIAHGESSGHHLSTYRGHFAAWGACVALGSHAELVHHHASLHELEPVVHAGRAARLLAYRSAGMALLDGRLEEAEDWIDQATSRPNPFSPEWDLASMATVLLPLRLEQGRAAELLPFSQAGAAEHPFSGVWQALVARCAFASGDLELASGSLGTLAAGDGAMLARDQSFLAALSVGAVVAIGVDDRAAATVFTELLLPYRHLGVWCGQGSFDPVGTTLARLAIHDDRPDEAAEHITESLAVARRLRAPIFERRAIGIAEMLRNHGFTFAEVGNTVPSVEAAIAEAEKNGWVALAHDLQASLSP